MKQKMNPDIRKERAKCSFDKEELTWLLDGGKAATGLRRNLENYILSTPGLYEGIGAHDFLSHEDRYTKSIEKASQLLKVCLKANEEIGEGSQYEALRMFNSSSFGGSIIPDGNPFALHFVMFLPTLTGQGTLEQQSEWLGRAWNCEIQGTYAQTELGHGTFLRGLETRADYDPAAQEFVFNSPTLSSMKWWPGGLGKTANYAIVPAHLYIRGHNHGMHTFIVQLRSEEDHSSLPGVTVGEIGPKYGMNSNDQGFLMLKNVRVPLKNMLMKHAQVLPDGTYVKPKNAKLSYGTMIFVRVVICRDVASQLQKAVTIAVRYSAVRRQSQIQPDRPEVQIMDFVTQQVKLFPALASVFAIHFAAQDIWESYHEVTASIQEGDMQGLPELHTKSCAMKALSSNDAANWIDILRRACGGHGYLLSSNLPKIFAQVTAACTYEGENTVLWLQVARNILKPEFILRQRAMGASQPRKRLVPDQGVLNMDAAVQAFLAVSCGRIQEAYDAWERAKATGVSPEVAWNMVSIRLVAAGEAYARHYIVERFYAGVKSVQVGPGLEKLLGSLCRLYALFWIREMSGDFLRFGGLTKNDMLDVDRALEVELAIIRPEAVNLVDSFDLRDEVVNSVLGCYDGNVYERLYEVAKKSPLNEKDVPDAYEKYLKPLMQQSKL